MEDSEEEEEEEAFQQQREQWRLPGDKGQIERPNYTFKTVDELRQTSKKQPYKVVSVFIFSIHHSITFIPLFYYTHKRMYILHTQTFTYTHVCTRTHTNIYIYTCMYTYTHKHLHIHMYVHVHIHMYV